MLAAKNIDIGNAFNVLEIMSREESKRMAYEARQAELMDQRTRMAERLHRRTPPKRLERNGKYEDSWTRYQFFYGDIFAVGGKA